MKQIFGSISENLLWRISVVEENFFEVSCELYISYIRYRSYKQFPNEYFKKSFSKEIMVNSGVGLNRGKYNIGLKLSTAFSLVRSFKQNIDLPYIIHAGKMELPLRTLFNCFEILSCNWKILSMKIHGHHLFKTPFFPLLNLFSLFSDQLLCHSHLFLSIYIHLGFNVIKSLSIFLVTRLNTPDITTKFFTLFCLWYYFIILH